MTTCLSKSRLMAALQCERRLWLEVHRPELLPVVAPDTGLERRAALAAELTRYCALDTEGLRRLLH